ncbi:MAG: cytochrome c biogenesis protein CcsA, partial [Polyangiaceae bacterium]|nr:cytochrome c biogenesis protein CcsA [Polyangiaceae bacterium]
MWHTIPELGTGLIVAALVGSGFAFCLGVLSAVFPGLLVCARRAVYGSASLCASAVLVLAYAFITHDFRLGYVVRYSDRSMPFEYLVSALWGGQDGSLLWWMFLLAACSVACIAWLRDRHLAFQPHVIAVLTGTIVFFGIVTLVAANPFAVRFSGAPFDGLGLNPILQSVYMMVHPPTLYLGFVGCTIPFAFVIAALVSGKLDQEWVVAVRRWMLFAWLFLSVGNALGMIWAYVELGWGGYWNWDPVENASLLPWLTATAYLHSSIVQTQRPLFKLWNVVLVSLTFFLTIFGTFLTRSGAIASVHAFGESNLGTYFLWYLAIVITLTAALVVWRLPKLRSRASIDSTLSKDAAFSVNNWVFVAATAFVLVATTLPLLTNLIIGRAVSVGPEFFDRWMTPFGLSILALMGVATLFGWRETNRRSLLRALIFPCAAALLVSSIHATVGDSVGFPASAYTHNTSAVGELSTSLLGRFGAIVPVLTVCLVVFNLAVVIQQLWGSWRSKRGKPRYGGLAVHVGIVLMIFGFLGQTWGISSQASLQPGQSAKIGSYSLKYESFRVETDSAKEMYFVDLRVTGPDGENLGKLSPAKYLYRTHQGQPSSKVDVLRGVWEDLYVVVGSLAPADGKTAVQLHVNPLVSFVWLGLVLVAVGACVALRSRGARSRFAANSLRELWVSATRKPALVSAVLIVGVG